MRNFWPGLFGFLALLLFFLYRVYPERIAGAVAFVGAWFTIVLWLIAAGIAGTLALGAYIVWVKAQNVRMRQEDGSYPLQKRWLRGGRVLYFKPDMMIGAAAIIDRDGNIAEPEHPAGWASVAAVRAAYEHTNGLRAIHPGDQARRNGALPDRAPSGRQPLQLTQTIPAVPPERPALPDKSRRPVTIYSAFRDNTDTALAAGVSADAERVYRWDVEIDPHLRIHGATQGAGKTNLAKTLLSGALLRGHHAIVADRRQFKRFLPWAGKIEKINGHDPEELTRLLAWLTAHYRREDENQADGGRVDRRVFVLFSEFGSMCKDLRARGAYDAFAQPLGILAREAGGAGVHLLFEDQVAESDLWPADVIGNSTAMIGRMPSRSGMSVGYYHSDKLPPYSFYAGGETFKTWDLDRYEEQIIERVRDRSARVRPAPAGVFGPPPAGGIPRDEPPTNGADERPDEPIAEKRDAVWAWRDANPDAESQAQMRRELARAGIEISKGHASDCWNTWPGPATGAEQLARLGLSIDEIEVRGRRLR